VTTVQGPAVAEFRPVASVTRTTTECVPSGTVELSKDNSLLASAGQGMGFENGGMHRPLPLSNDSFATGTPSTSIAAVSRPPPSSCAFTATCAKPVIGALVLMRDPLGGSTISGKLRSSMVKAEDVTAMDAAGDDGQLPAAIVLQIAVT
jgi:hypothetical protein